MYGYLRVRVYTSRKMFPIKNARVEISRISEGKREVITNVLTDENGNTGDIKLSVSPVNLSSKYSVATQADGFVSDKSDEICIYKDIISVKSVELVLEDII